MPGARTRWARDVVPRAVLWVIPDLVARGIVTLMAGPRNAGKTMLGTWLAARVTELGLYVWLNSLEDGVETVLRPRCEVAGADLDRVRLSDTPYRFPRDLDRFAEEIRRHRDDGKPDSAILLDSASRHIPGHSQTSAASEAAEGLRVIAEEYGVGILLVAHFMKGHAVTVEQAIGGAGVLQNLAKCILVVGPQPRDSEDRLHALLEPEDRLPRLVLAPERMGIASLPSSLLFELDAKRFEPTDRAEPFLRLLGETRATALDVLRATRKDAAGPSVDETKAARATAWIIGTLETEGPMPTSEFERLAREAGVFFSRNTFDRARGLAHAVAVHPSEVEELMGAEKYRKLTSEERRLHWVRSGWTGAPLPPAAVPKQSPTPPRIPDGGSMGEWGSP